MKPHIRRDGGKARSIASETGSALAIAVLMLLVISMIGAGVLLTVSARYNGTQKAKGWQEALFAAEAGADAALANLRWSVIPGSPTAFDPDKGWSGPDANGVYTYAMPAIQQSAQGSTQMWAVVTVDAPPEANPVGLRDSSGGQWFRVRSTGYALLPGLARVSVDNRVDANTKGDNLLRKLSLRLDRKTGAAISAPRASRTIEVIFQPKTPFVAGLIASSSISGPPSIDSFDSTDPAKSTDGQYDSAKFQSHGDVIGNSTSVDVGTVWGNVGSNGGNVQPNSNIHGQIDNNVSVYIPPVSAPNWTSFNVSPNNITSNVTLTSTSSPQNYKVSSINGNLTIALPPGQTSGAINIWVTGDIKGSITVAQGVTARIWFEGDISVKARDLTAYRASDLQLYGVDPPPGANRKVDIAPPGPFSAAIYAPGHDFKTNGNPDLSGALITKSFQGNGNTSLHYDEALAGAGIPIDYVRASWVEDTR